MPTDAQIKEIEDLIQEALDLEKAGNSKAAKEKKQRAIALTDKYYEIPGDHCDGEPVYDPKIRGEGESTPVGKEKVKVFIGDKAFVFCGKPSAAHLATTKVHEILGHGPQANGPNKWKPAPGADEAEVEAYNKELEWKDRTGIGKAVPCPTAKTKRSILDEAKARKKRAFGRMPKARQDVWKKKEPWLVAGVILDPTTGETALAGLGTFDDVIAAFRVPAGVIVRGATSIETVERESSVLEVAKRLTGGRISELMERNPEFTISPLDVRRVLVGPTAEREPISLSAADVAPVTLEGVREFASTPTVPASAGDSVAEALATLLRGIALANGPSSGPTGRVGAPQPFSSTSTSAAGVVSVGKAIRLKAPLMSAGGVLTDIASAVPATDSASDDSLASMATGAAVTGDLPPDA